MRAFLNSKGDKLVKRIKVTLFTPGNKHKRTTIFAAGPGKGYNEDQIHNILDKFAAAVERQYPQEEFRLVPLGYSQFNIVHEGKKATCEVKEE